MYPLAKPFQNLLRQDFCCTTRIANKKLKTTVPSTTPKVTPKKGKIVFREIKICTTENGLYGMLYSVTKSKTFSPKYFNDSLVIVPFSFNVFIAFS